MKLPRRQFLHLAAGAAVLPALSCFAWAQVYPTRPVRIIVGYFAGSAADVPARLIGQWLSERLGQPFIIENRPGASSNLATQSVARASPDDGYTLLVVSAINAWNTTIYDNLSFDFVRDIAPVASIYRSFGVLVVNPSFPATAVPELIAYGKANPGKINMASVGAGSPPHVYGELFKMMIDIDMLHVPYPRVSPMHDLLGGQVQVMFSPIVRRSILSGRASCARLRSRPRRVSRRCRTSRPWLNSSQATRRAPGLASVRQRTRPSKSSTSSTRRSTPASLIRPSPRGSPMHFDSSGLTRLLAARLAGSNRCGAMCQARTARHTFARLPKMLLK
jgi:tripartite-type tricarboxylate transporter receptor subunit TctC